MKIEDNFESKKTHQDNKYGFQNAAQVLDQLHVQESKYNEAVAEFKSGNRKNAELLDETEKFLVDAKGIVTAFALEKRTPDTDAALQEINRRLSEVREVKGNK